MSHSVTVISDPECQLRGAQKAASKNVNEEKTYSGLFACLVLIHLYLTPEHSRLPKLPHPFNLPLAWARFTGRRCSGCRRRGAPRSTRWPRRGYGTCGP